jgi:exopolysaccharide biosynthesis polyprenyl glycosylphosphotransferase
MTLRLLLVLGDGVAALLVFLLVSRVRFEADQGAIWSVGIDVGPAAFVFATVWVAVGWSLGLYRMRVRWSLRAEAGDVARVAIVALVVTLSSLFLLHQDNVSRVFLGLLFVVQPAVAVAGRALLRSWFNELRRRGSNLTYMVIAGTGQLAQAFADQVEAHPELGIRVVGHLAVPVAARRATDDANRASSAPPDPKVSRPVIGTIDQMSQVFRSEVIDEVAVCLPPASTSFLETIIAIAAGEGKTVRVPRDPEEGILSGALREDFGEFLVRSVTHDSQRDPERAAKRMVDVIVASLALLILSPVMAVSAVAVLLRDGSPVLFRQTRVGLHGRPFTIYKFRTMSADAEERYPQVAALSDTRGAAFKMYDDPRVTPTGRLLRKWTIDELPQLVNVLKGDMSLVGPRPAPAREVEQYDIWHRRRLSVRPGMTGLWQVQARVDHHFDDRASLDLRYIDQWSLWMDLRILLKTLPAVLTRQGR